MNPNRAFRFFFLPSLISCTVIHMSYVNFLLLAGIHDIKR
jgi:hypothetical protein